MLNLSREERAPLLLCLALYFMTAYIALDLLQLIILDSQ